MRTALTHLCLLIALAPLASGTEMPAEHILIESCVFAYIAKAESPEDPTTEVEKALLQVDIQNQDDMGDWIKDLSKTHEIYVFCKPQMLILPGEKHDLIFGEPLHRDPPDVPAIDGFLRITPHEKKSNEYSVKITPCLRADSEVVKSSDQSLDIVVEDGVISAVADLEDLFPALLTRTEEGHNYAMLIRFTMLRFEEADEASSQTSDE